VSEFTRRGTVRRSSARSRTATLHQTYNLSIDLLDKSGAVVDTQTATVGPVAAKSAGTFKITSTKGGVYGYKYKPLT
jgi:hypothetical protein